VRSLRLARHPRVAGRSRLPAAVVVLLGVLLIVGSTVGILALRPHRVDAGTVPIAPSSSTINADTAAAPGQRPAQPAASPEPPPPAPQLSAGRPVRLSLPALGIDAAVDPVAVTNGALGVPADVHRLGWWSTGALAGAAVGTTVIDGHVDSATDGPGALFRLASTPVGATIDLTSPRRTVRYVVQARRSYPKTALPANLFTQTGPARLALITCGGSFDVTHRHYSDNIVIYATLT